MKTQVALVVLLLAVVALVPTHGVRRRAAVANPYKGVQRNIKHNYGSAAAYFALLDQYRPGKVDRIIKKNFPAGRKQLEKEVDQDADMVSAKCPTRTFSPSRNSQGTLHRYGRRTLGTKLPRRFEFIQPGCTWRISAP